MERFFNVAGMCRPDKHLTVEPEGRLKKLRPLIDREAWLVERLAGELVACERFCS